MLYPKANASENNVFLYRVNYGRVEFIFYSHSQIYRAETLVGLSTKCGSTTVYQYFLPENIQKRWNYWNLLYSLGIADCSRSFMIDLDKCGFFVGSTN